MFMTTRWLCIGHVAYVFRRKKNMTLYYFWKLQTRIQYTKNKNLYFVICMFPLVDNRS